MLFSRVIAPAYEKMSHEYRQVEFFKCDVDQNQDISSGQGVRAMPTFIIYKNGSKVETVCDRSKCITSRCSLLTCYAIVGDRRERTGAREQDSLTCRSSE